MTASTPISLYASERPLKSVTIFRSSIAQLTRTFTVELKAGRNVIEIAGISNLVEAGSPRIHGLGSDARVFDISCNKSLERAPGPKRSKHAASLKLLGAKEKALAAERDVRNQEIDMLVDVTRSGATGSGDEKQLSFLDGIVKRKRDAAKAVLELEEQLTQIRREIWMLENTHRGQTTSVITTTLLAKRDSQVDFLLTYLVSGASWQPYYDLHATTSEGKTSPEVSLIYCAEIVQSTGEDWSDTALTLSTANSQALKSLSVPTVDALKVLPAQPPPPPRPLPQTRGAFGAFGAAAGGHATGLFGTSGGPAAPPAPPPAPMVAMASTRERDRERARVLPKKKAATPASLETDGDDFDVAWVDEVEEDAAESAGTVLDRNSLSLSYRVEGAVTLPSDGVAHRVAVVSLDFNAELKHVCVPRKSPAAFIEARVKNTSDYELLAGPVSVFMDEEFVTKTSLDLIAVNQSFDCVLGVDAALRVSYVNKSRTEHEPRRNFAEPSKTTTRTVTTTVTNGHDFDILALVVRDVIPLGDEDANIQVMLRKPEGLARAKDGEEIAVEVEGDAKDVKVRWTKPEDGKGGEKDGMYEWVCGVPAGKKARLEAEWDVKAPGTLRWEETSGFKSNN